MTKIDTMLHAHWIIPVSEGDPCLVDHTIAIHEDRIIEILPTKSARNRYQASVEQEYGHLITN